MIAAALLLAVSAAAASMGERIESAGARFVGTPYKLGPLGEGPAGTVDRDPLWRLDAFDCTTFVEHVLALSQRGDPKDHLRDIRYDGGKVAFETRNHFTELDWIPNLIRGGYLRDVTRELAGEKTAVAEKTVSKRDWYAKMSTSSFEGAFTEAERAEGLPKLRALGEAFADAKARLPYLPVAAFAEVFPRIPTGTIGNLVHADRPDIPTMISHQVFFIQKKEGTFLRHASSSAKKVQDEPALAFFKKYEGRKWPLLGVNLNEPLPRGK